MATGTNDDLTNRLRGEPGVAPEDTRTELLEEIDTSELRDRVSDVPGVSPEDTRAELLDAAKEARKADEAEAMLADQRARARAWTVAQALEQLARDIAAHAAIERSGDAGFDAFYLRGDMARQAEENSAYAEGLKATAPELHERVQGHAAENDSSSVDVAAFNAAEADRAAEAAKEDRKAAEAQAMQADREAEALGWSVPQAQAQAARDVADHSELDAIGRPAESDAYYLRSDMALRASLNPTYAQAVKQADTALFERVENNARDGAQAAANLPRAGAQKQAAELPSIPAATAAATTPERSVKPQDEAVTQPAPLDLDLSEAQAAAAVNQGLQAQANEDLRRRKARELEEAGQGLNSVDLQRLGRELERGEFIVPRRIVNAYTEVDGKFFAKATNRVMFEDRGEKLATSTTDKTAVSDMVAYAKAKQWESLKLTGSQEFRREAWLQAESQGIRTQGYTPKQSDLAALETLRQERSTNSIAPLEQPKTQEAKEPGQQAPRHDLNKNQASMHAEATKSITTNLQALQQQPGMANKPVDDLTKLAYWRGIVAESNKLQPKTVQDEAIARFDKQAADPQFLKRLTQETGATVQDKTSDRVVQQRTAQEEQTL